MLLKCPTPGVVEVVKDSELLQNSTHHWKINADIVAIIMAWGLEIASSREEVEWVMKNLFPANLIVGMESLLEGERL